MHPDAPDQPPAHITCVDCLGRCWMLTYPPEDGFQEGDVVAYRCEDCMDRWDIVWETVE